MRYRPEIDGLRALAVAPVILFHAGFGAFSGGFVGVDVFFVISGFLITSLILEEREEGSFSYLGFYERRARRILPALFLVAAVCLPFAWYLLFPRDMKDFAESLLAIATFSSNFLFWRESGYFETAAELKPLLHTWSLAVEEQFYILFPLLLSLVSPFGRGKMRALFMAGLLVSLSAAQYGAHNHPSATFFLLPTRAWELLLGALLALRRNPSGITGASIATREILGLCGLVLIALPVFLYDKATPFPGLYALPPTLGTFLLILFAREGTFCHRLLSNRLLVGGGLLSYSAYLWHQPLFAFARYGRLEEEPLWLTVLLCLSVMPLSYATWRWVERPFRRRGERALPILPVASGFACAFAVFFAAALATNGLAFRATSTEQTVQAFQEYPYEELYLEGLCFLEEDQAAERLGAECFAKEEGAPMLWGDSHAAALAPGLRKEAGEISQVTASGCPPLIGEVIEQPFRRPLCKEINERIAASLASTRPGHLYLLANWLFYAGRLDALEKTVSRVKKESPGSEIWILGGVPQWQPDLPTVFLAENLRLNFEELYLPTPETGKIAAVNEELKKKAAELSVGYLDPLELFCREGACQATQKYKGAIELTAWDYGHLTFTAAARLANWIETKARGGL